MSLGHFLLEDGMELELSAELGEVISSLDGAVRSFDFGGYGYRIQTVNGVIGDRWNLTVKAWDSTAAAELPPAVAFIQVGGLGGGSTGLKILSRAQWPGGGAEYTGEDAKLFSRFAFELLNALHGEGLLDLPGPLPIE